MTTAADTATSERRDTLAREYLGKLLERHRLGASENDIRAAFRDFLLRTGIAADESEIVTETRPAADSRSKVDLYLRNTYVEFRRSIIIGGAIDPEAISGSSTATSSKTPGPATASRTESSPTA